MAENTIFEETQRLHQNAVVRFVTPVALLGVLVATGTALIGQGSSPIGLAAMITAAALVTAGFAMLPMRTTITPEEVSVRTLLFYHKRLAIASIESAEAVTYNPISECGGWGIRPTRKHGLVLNIAGDRGVALRYSRDGVEKSMLIGSRRSEELEHAIRVAANLADGLAGESPEHGGAPSSTG